MQPDDRLLINPFSQAERRFNVQCQEAGIEPRVPPGEAPIGIRKTIFALAWKSAIGNYGGPHGGQFPIRIGLERGEEDSMVVTEIKIAYSRIQGDVFMWRVKATRRSIPTLTEITDGKGNTKTVRVMLDGVGSEQNFRVSETTLEEGFKKLGGRAARYMLGEVSERSQPEPVDQAIEKVKVYRVSVYREDRTLHMQVFKTEDVPVMEGLVRAMLALRTKDILDEPMECPGVYPDVYLGGSKKRSVNSALGDLRKDESRRG